ncbi:MAG TPA: twin-arginine translocase TatA/TatE family subunit [Fimbriimonas sp.]|nr:twin-arginine translocase TatA/TatE family subunit [Fimbriimonas sp.]
MFETLALIGPQEGMLIVVVLLVLFGGSKIPELMRGVGKGVGELKRGIDETKSTIKDS